MHPNLNANLSPMFLSQVAPQSFICLEYQSSASAEEVGSRDHFEVLLQVIAAGRQLQDLAASHELLHIHKGTHIQTSLVFHVQIWKVERRSCTGINGHPGARTGVLDTRITDLPILTDPLTYLRGYTAS